MLTRTEVRGGEREEGRRRGEEGRKGEAEGEGGRGQGAVGERKKGPAQCGGRLFPPWIIRFWVLARVRSRRRLLLLLLRCIHSPTIINHPFHLNHLCSHHGFLCSLL